MKKDRKKLVEKSYDKQSKVYDSEYVDRGPYFDFEYKLLDSLRKPAKVLDLGCGTGRHSIYLAKKGFEVTGFDLSSGMLKKAREKSHKSKTKIKFVKGDMSELKKFKDDSFDYVVCMYHSLSYVSKREQRQKVVNEVHRVLKKDGKAIFIVRNIIADIFIPRWWGFLFRTTFRTIDKDLEFGDNITKELLGAKTFVHMFTPKEFRDYFKKARFSKIELNFVNEKTGKVCNLPLKSIYSVVMVIEAVK